MVRWSSQEGQDARVAQLLGHTRGGYFVDLAANDPYRISNSVALETFFGWHGLCIDATAHSMRRFAGSNRTCQFVRAIVGNSPPRDVLFRDIVAPPQKGGPLENFDGVSSVVADEHADTCWGAATRRMCVREAALRRGGALLEHTRMRTRTLTDVLEEHHAPRTIDYLSLDVRCMRPESSDADVTRPKHRY
jgi:hypothetical protein